MPLRKILFIVLLAAAAGQAQRQVAVTIDDLPRGGDLPGSAAADRAMTVKLLAPLKAGDVPVTGFVNACRHADEARDLLKLWVAAGADLGNHTCSHLDLSSTSANEFIRDTVKNEAIIIDVLGWIPRFFRYPYLHTGMEQKTKEEVEAFLKKRGYILAPVTLDDDDYVFARVYAHKLVKNDSVGAARVLTTYVKYMESIFAFFERWGQTVTGHELKQILLIHANQLNADAMPDLLRMMKGRGYEFIALGEALTDDTYQLPDSYAGPMGISWIHRWAMEKGMKIQPEPDVPDWVLAEYKQEAEK